MPHVLRLIDAARDEIFPRTIQLRGEAAQEHSSGRKSTFGTDGEAACEIELFGPLVERMEKLIDGDESVRAARKLRATFDDGASPPTGGPRRQRDAALTKAGRAGGVLRPLCSAVVRLWHPFQWALPT